jgi:hypothetical protein
MSGDIFGGHSQGMILASLVQVRDAAKSHILYNGWYLSYRITT